MAGRGPHERALRNHENARVPEGKLRYPLRDPNKCRAFEALGYSEEAGNWRDLRDAIVKSLPFYPARFNRSTVWDDIYYVDVIIGGPSGKEAPVRVGWIYRSGEDYPRLTTLYVKTTEWRRLEREGRIRP